jgi:hypothetical protein
MQRLVAAGSCSTTATSGGMPSAEARASAARVPSRLRSRGGNAPRRGGPQHDAPDPLRPRTLIWSGVELTEGGPLGAELEGVQRAGSGPPPTAVGRGATDGPLLSSVVARFGSETPCVAAAARGPRRAGPAVVGRQGWLRGPTSARALRLGSGMGRMGARVELPDSGAWVPDRSSITGLPIAPHGYPR